MFCLCFDISTLLLTGLPTIADSPLIEKIKTWQVVGLLLTRSQIWLIFSENGAVWIELVCSSISVNSLVILLCSQCTMDYTLCLESVFLSCFLNLHLEVLSGLILGLSKQMRVGSRFGRNKTIRQKLAMGHLQFILQKNRPFFGGEQISDMRISIRLILLWSKLNCA